MTWSGADIPYLVESEIALNNERPIEGRQSALAKCATRRAVQTDACGGARPLGTSQETQTQKRGRRSLGRTALEQNNCRTASKNHAACQKGPRKTQTHEMSRPKTGHHLRRGTIDRWLFSELRIWTSLCPSLTKVVRKGVRDKNRKIFLTGVVGIYGIHSHSVRFC